jgi:hypothetical protein
LEIGTILAKQTVNIVVWGKGNTFYQDGDPILTHKHGQAISLTRDLRSFYDIPLVMLSSFFLLLILASVISYNSIWLLKSWRELAETQNVIKKQDLESEQLVAQARGLLEDARLLAKLEP